MAGSSVSPTNEIGNAAAGIIPWSPYFDTFEDVVELAFPNSVHTYNKMRNDEQIAALLLSFILPIQGYRWSIDPNGARDEVVEHVASDFGLPIEGQEPGPQARRRDRFSFGTYLQHSMLKLSLGFMFFEQVYRVGDDGKLHIRKLAPRMPGSISQIQAAPDGGLQYIRQFPAGNSFDPTTKSNTLDVGLYGVTSPLIPVDRLIAHVNEKEGSNWYGRSWLRSIYRNWLVKDRLIRVDALKHERNGMGVPIAEAPPNASDKQMADLSKLAQAYKSGEGSGGAIPNGSSLTLEGVRGTLPDTLSSIRYHDEQMAKRFLAMFTSLGQSATGSRALGNTFVDFFSLAQNAVAKSFADVTNEHAIEDLVDLNYGIDESVPILKFRPESDRALATADLVALITAKAITVDPDLEDFIRADYNLPEKTEDDSTGSEDDQGGSGDPAVPPAAQNQRRPKIRASLKIKAAASQRDPNNVEERSKVDFAALQAAFKTTLSEVVSKWNSDVKPQQIEELSASIASTGADDLDGLLALSATPLGSDILTDAMQSLAAIAADAAIKEIRDQDVDLDDPDLTDLNATLSIRASAIDRLMASSISQAARDAALSESGGALTSADMAVNVADHLNSLSDAYLTQQLGGALMQAQNGARKTVFNAVPNKRIYASELTDTPNCCEACEHVDGKEYDSIEAAEVDYPLGGFVDCEGGYRCRGTLVVIASTESEPSAQ